MSLMACPFCGETDFDKVGLKRHLTVWGCEAFEEIEELTEVPAKEGK